MGQSSLDYCTVHNACYTNRKAMLAIFPGLSVQGIWEGGIMLVAICVRL